ncbi:hypothetical protein GLAREA_10669 [Glarea lozoyensis ATCC 20868]|uniref:Uncharacterized protein n=1 Tax=Glarea lozoyensis (strain ATCC 20868 / MF5171) TaxID=1116229 RepID=S3DD04_GLAL2|nr:uncharacterized protein GLAREA_10669 [Glarea lozoyensis ATCC 20868]EPE34974.1 hypothetical protein GLAREA_10669 [Glarea lozoyensis ATCC 20868]
MTTCSQPASELALDPILGSNVCLIANQEANLQVQTAFITCCGQEGWSGNDEGCATYCNTATQADADEWTACMNYSLYPILLDALDSSCSDNFAEPLNGILPANVIPTTWRATAATAEATQTGGSSSSIAVSLTTSVPAGSSSTAAPTGSPSASGAAAPPSNSTITPPSVTAAQPSTTATSPPAGTNPPSSNASGRASISYGATALFGLVLFTFVL